MFFEVLASPLFLRTFGFFASYAWVPPAALKGKINKNNMRVGIRMPMHMYHELFDGVPGRARRDLCSCFSQTSRYLGILAWKNFAAEVFSARGVVSP